MLSLEKHATCEQQVFWRCSDPAASLKGLEVSFFPRNGLKSRAWHMQQQHRQQHHHQQPLESSHRKGGSPCREVAAGAHQPMAFALAAGSSFSGRQASGLTNAATRTAHATAASARHTVPGPPEQPRQPWQPRTKYLYPCVSHQAGHQRQTRPPVTQSQQQQSSSSSDKATKQQQAWVLSGDTANVAWVHDGAQHLVAEQQQQQQQRVLQVRAPVMPAQAPAEAAAS